MLHVTMLQCPSCVYTKFELLQISSGALRWPHICLHLPSLAWSHFASSQHLHLTQPQLRVELNYRRGGETSHGLTQNVHMLSRKTQTVVSTGLVVACSTCLSVYRTGRLCRTELPSDWVSVRRNNDKKMQFQCSVLLIHHN